MTIALRWYQEDLITGVNNTFNEGFNRVLTVLPCGGGKTFTATKLCEPFKKVLWLAHRKRLLWQASEAFHKVGRHDVTFHSIFKTPDPSWGKFDLVVVDEAHHEACRTIRNILDSVKFDKLLGLTATPIREDNATLFFDAQVYGTNLNDLVALEFLAQPLVWTIRCRNKLESLASWMNNNLEMLGQSIVFVKSVDEAEQFKKLLQIDSEIVTGKSNKEKQMAAYESGQVKILLSCLVLTEGIDMPCTKSVVIARNTKSRTMMTQMIGRAMRNFPGKNCCNLIEGILYKAGRNVFIKHVVKPYKHFVCSRQQSGWTTAELKG